MKDWLVESLDYDLWATKIWLNALPALTHQDEAYSICAHMLGAQRIWIERCGEKNLPDPDADFATAFADLNVRWKRILDEHDLDERFAYKNRNGDAHVSPLHEIVRHVTNHGTYHRGQMRGLCNDADLSFVPDTDLFLFFRRQATPK